MPSPSILGPGQEIFVKLPFHAAAYIMGLPGLVRARVGILLVLRKIVRKTKPVYGLNPEIGLNSLGSELLCAFSRKADRLDLCDI